MKILNFAIDSMHLLTINRRNINKQLSQTVNQILHNIVSFL
ncbi:hypothetical protein DERP_010473 [Dermatophagoides pteronyssinus]|uniref:Transposase n=1 Tax=Dermatophagoides pteronyssinus TaxID=6956 RepID=A0ABQ8J532_DERPT|nr:hypothetical protein DERP_010473 [Dermatophagoides pteronyssinus]